MLVFFSLIQLLFIQFIPGTKVVQAKTQPGLAQLAKTYQAQVIEVDQSSQDAQTSQQEQAGHNLFGSTSFQAKVRLTSGVQVGQEVEAQIGLISHGQQSGQSLLRPGQKVVVTTAHTAQGLQYIISDYYRLPAVWVLLALFVLAVLIVSRLKGVRALLSMLLSFALIFAVILPLLTRGFNPVLVTVLSASFIIPVSFYLSHGWNHKTHAAVLGTVVALIFSACLANLFVRNGYLTGFSSEEAGLLNIERHQQLNIQGLLLAGIIISLLGTLDDVTITQSGLVFQLQANNPDLKPGSLYQQAMQIGQDHIASMINTLVLVYAGAALPLLLLFINNPRPLWFVLNQEVVAEEIVRMLIGSIGLMLAAPVTTALAVIMAGKEWLLSKLRFSGKS